MTKHARFARVAMALAFAGFFAAALPARAAEPDVESGGIAIAGRLSTLGPGVELHAPFGRYLKLRLGFNLFSLDYTDTQEDVDFNVDARLRTGAALLDWFPAGGGFRFSFGAMYNGNQLKGMARLRKNTTIGDVEFTPAQIGTLAADVEFPNLAGYAGIGFGNATSPGSRLAVLFDLGVMFHNSPTLRLSADGTLSGQPAFQAELEKERRSIEDDFVKVARFYPVISLGLAFRF